MINKIVQSMADAMAGIKDGSTVLIGGFGAVGQPNALIDGLIEQGATDLTVAANNAGVGHIGARPPDGAGPGAQDHLLLPALLRSGGVRERCIARAGSSWRSCRRARWPNACAPPAPACPPSSPRPASARRWRMGKETREFDGRSYVMERALPGDVALVEAWEADRWGNLTFKESGRNFNPVIAMAADADHRADPAHPRTGRDAPGPRRHARHLRGPRAACTLR